jgi:hypothetical protein
MHKGRFYSQRRQNGSRDRGRLHPADYFRDATARAGRQAFAAIRPAGRGGMQSAESEFRNGWRGTLIRDEDTAVRIVVLPLLFERQAAVNLLQCADEVR